MFTVLHKKMHSLWAEIRLYMISSFRNNIPIDLLLFITNKGCRIQSPVHCVTLFK